MTYTSLCRGIWEKIGTMLQHEREHAKACEKSSKVRIEYIEAYEHVCHDMSPKVEKKNKEFDF